MRHLCFQVGHDCGENVANNRMHQSRRAVRYGKGEIIALT
jgi:hypothetical protein